MTSARERIRRTVERWFLVEPLLFAVWTTHHLVVEPRIRTIRVRQGRIEYHPEFIHSLSPQHLEAVLRCEVVRILLKHPYQRRKEQAVLHYLASHITLQESLHTGLPLPHARDIFGSGEFDRQYLEFYYYKLLELLDQRQLSGLLAGPGSSLAGEGITAQASLATYANAVTSGEENTQDWGNQTLLAERIDAHIRSAQESNRWGTVAGLLRERILATLAPQLDYRAVLRQFRTSILTEQRVLTRMKPNRRYGFLYMGSRRDFSTRLLFAVDVSGSMGSADLARGFAVINRFFKYGLHSIDVIQFDTIIQGERLSLKRARHAITLLGRGGTSFAPVMQYIDTHRGYDGLIIFTDGYAPVPPRPKNRTTRILWLFNNEMSYRQMQQGLRSLGRSAYLKATGGH